MKTIKLLTFLITLFILNSCNNDEDEQIDANGIMGSYRITSYTYKGNYILTRPDNTTVAVAFTGFGKNFNYQSEIRERPNTWTFQGTYDAESTRLSDGAIYNYTNIQVSKNSTWTKTGDNITITDQNGQVTNCLVTEGDNKYMVIKYSEPILYNTEGYYYDGSYTEIIMRLERNQ